MILILNICVQPLKAQSVDDILSGIDKEANDLDRLKSVLVDANKSKRAAVFTAIMEKGSDAHKVIAMDIAFNSSDTVLRGLALQEIFWNTPNLVITAIPPTGGKIPMGKGEHDNFWVQTGGSFAPKTLFSVKSRTKTRYVGRAGSFSFDGYLSGELFTFATYIKGNPVEGEVRLSHDRLEGFMTIGQYGLQNYPIYIPVR